MLRSPGHQFLNSRHHEFGMQRRSVEQRPGNPSAVSLSPRGNRRSLLTLLQQHRFVSTADSRPRVRVGMILPATRLEARSRARNRAGWSRWNDVVGVQTKCTPALQTTRFEEFSTDELLSEIQQRNYATRPPTSSRRSTPSGRRSRPGSRPGTRGGSRPGSKGGASVSGSSPTHTRPSTSQTGGRSCIINVRAGSRAIPNQVLTGDVQAGGQEQPTALSLRRIQKGWDIPNCWKSGTPRKQKVPLFAVLHAPVELPEIDFGLPSRTLAHSVDLACTGNVKC
eukprot:551498-Rhodomonas_salina.1